MKTNEQKKEVLKKHNPKSSFLANGLRAFIAGGSICAIGQVLYLFLRGGVLFGITFDEESSSLYVSYFFILLASILTAVGVFDRIARFAGAGTIVPVTGFSNSVTSQAIDAAGEGYVLGVGAKIFTVAGPVILYGMLSGNLYGLIFYIYKMLSGNM